VETFQRSGPYFIRLNEHEVVSGYVQAEKMFCYQACISVSQNISDINSK